MKNRPLQNKFRVIHHVVASYTEAELGYLFHNGQTIIPLRTTLEYLVHQQPLTRILREKSTALGIINSPFKQKNQNQFT